MLSPASPISAAGNDEPLRRRRRRWRRVVVVALAVTVLVVIGSLVLLAAVPSVGDAEALVGRVLAADAGADTGPPPPARVGRAVVAVEDQRFYRHHGVDVVGVVRAALGSLRLGDDQRGSTITQQLAKAIYPGTGGGVMSKAAQVGLAVKLETRYSKAQILEMYLNAVYFGDGRWVWPRRATRTSPSRRPPWIGPRPACPRRRPTSTPSPTSPGPAAASATSSIASSPPGSSAAGRPTTPMAN